MSIEGHFFQAILETIFYYTAYCPRYKKLYAGEPLGSIVTHSDLYIDGHRLIYRSTTIASYQWRKTRLL